MSETDYAWAAGFFEGDGAVGFYDRKHRPEKYWKVRVFNSDEAIIERFKELFGGVICFRKLKGTKTGKYRRKKDGFEWGVSHQKALKFARRILPYVVGEKKNKLLEIIKYYNEGRNIPWQRRKRTA